MKDGTMHKLANNMNSIPKNDVREGVRRIDDIDLELKQKHVITESKNTQSDITHDVFNKMGKVEQILELRDESRYLNRILLKRVSQISIAKNRIKEMIRLNNIIVNPENGGNDGK